MRDETIFLHWPGSIYFVNSVQSYIKMVSSLIFICYFCGKVLNRKDENRKTDYLR